MANTNTRNGFKPVMKLDGSPWNGKGRPYYKAAGTTVTNDLFIGDVVTYSDTGHTNGLAGVARATAGTGNAILGVVVGFDKQPDHPERDWMDGADAGVVYVCDDPNVIYEAQADEAVAVTAIGYNANLVKTAAGSRTTGCSGDELDGTVANTAAHQFKIVGFPDRSDNEINATYNKVLVIPNNHVFKGGTGTVGV